MVERLLEGLQRSGKLAVDRLRHPELLLDGVDFLGGLAERNPRRQIERHRYGGEQTGVIDGERRGGGSVSGNRVERDRARARTGNR